MAGKGQPGFSQLCGTTWGSNIQSQGAFNLVPAHAHLIRADLAKPWHLEDGEWVLSWSSTLTWAEGRTPRVLAGTSPFPSVFSTPRRHFPSLAALSPLDPSVMLVDDGQNILTSTCRSFMCPYYEAVSPLCHAEPITCPSCWERCLDPGTQHRNVRAPAPHPQRNN